MKQIFFLAFLLISVEVSAQFSLSAGVQRRKDLIPDSSRYWQLDKQSRYINNLYFISVDFQHKKWLYHADVSWLHNDLHFTESKNILDSQGSHGGYSIRSLYQYEADVKYNYLGLKLGVDRVDKVNDRFLVLIGAFAQIEMLVSEKERNHKMHRTTHFTGWDFDEEHNAAPTTTYYPVSEKEFDALTLRTPFLSWGLEFKPRLSFNQVFVEFNFATGLSYLKRTFGNLTASDSWWDDYIDGDAGVEQKTLNFLIEGGVKIGCTFK